MTDKIFIPQLWENKSVINLDNYAVKSDLNNFHLKNTNLNMNNYKITNINDASDDNDVVNKKQLDEKVDTIFFANLSKDVGWLLEHHLLPDTYNTQIQQLITRIGTIESKAVKLATKVDTLPVTTGDNDHLLVEVNSNIIVISTNFFFQTSNQAQWHDLSTKNIKEILGDAYIKQKIIGANKQILLYTSKNEWWVKPVFTNYYTLQYKLEYCYREQINLSSTGTFRSSDDSEDVNELNNNIEKVDANSARTYYALSESNLRELSN